MAAWLGVLHRHPGTPLDVGGKSRAKLRIVGQSGFVGSLIEQAGPPCPLFLGEPFPEVLGKHAGVATVCLGVVLWASKHLSEPGGHPLRMVWGHVGEQRPNQWVLGNVLLIEQAGEPRQRR